LTGKWTTTFNKTGIVLTTGKVFDPAWGKVMEICSFAYGGAAEPAFVKNVIAKSGFQRVKPGSKRTTPNNQIITLPDDPILLSDTGEWGGLMVLPMELKFFGTRTVVIATVLKPSN